MIQITRLSILAAVWASLTLMPTHAAQKRTLAYYQAEIRRLHYETKAIYLTYLDQNLIAFQMAKTCDEKITDRDVTIFHRLHSWADTLAEHSRSMTDELREGPWTANEVVSENQESAARYNAIAHAAEEKGCRALAHETYLEVIERFIGSSYQATRQRAQIGLDDLRANSQ